MVHVTDWEKLLRWATVKQREVAEAYIANGESYAKTGHAIGMSRQSVKSHIRNLRRRANKAGFSPEHDMTHPVPDGYHVKGISTLFDGDGNVTQQWVKSKADNDLLLDNIGGAVESFSIPFAPTAPPAPVCNEDLLTVLPMGDVHLGLIAHHSESGEDFSPEIAEANLVAAVDYLVEQGPATGHALIVNIGDYFHSDRRNGSTTKGTPVDTDVWAKVVRIGIRTMKRLIDLSLERHGHVTVICEIGNHDTHAAWFLALCLEQHYELNPRVHIDTSPMHYHYYRFGKVLIGTHHGNLSKPAQLLPIMAVDRREDWGETLYRKWIVGHIHHKTVHEFPGGVVESLRTLAGSDRWHHSQGYRSGREMWSEVYHREFGLQARSTVGIRRVRAG